MVWSVGPLVTFSQTALCRIIGARRLRLTHLSSPLSPSSTGLVGLALYPNSDLQHTVRGGSTTRDHRRIVNPGRSLKLFVREPQRLGSWTDVRP